jgi:dihydrofolate reductase
MELTLIAAVAENGVIGRDGEMPWYFPDDLKRFKQRTLGHTVIVGRVTYESIVDRIGGPLPGRTNVVLTRHPERVDTSDPAVRVATTTDEAIQLAREAGAEQAFVAGGASLYEQFLPIADRLVLTEIHGSFEGDTRFPDWERENWHATERETREELSFVTYERHGDAAGDSEQ